MRARANLLILLGGILLVIFYANPVTITVSSPAELMQALARPPTAFETVLPWLKLGGIVLVGIGAVLNLIVRTRKRGQA